MQGTIVFFEHDCVYFHFNFLFFGRFLKKCQFGLLKRTNLVIFMAKSCLSHKKSVPLHPQIVFMRIYVCTSVTNTL